MKSKERVKSLGEVFTPPELVERMLDRLPDELWADDTKTFCDPACGNGNFLVAVLRRKLQRGHEPLLALSCVYGVDIMTDNVEEARARLLEEAKLEGSSSARALVELNVVCHDSLTYDWSFNNSND